jgi:hypothetical protein
MSTAIPVSRAVSPQAPGRLRTDSKPWYRQFWPWFVISLPAISVAFSIATLVIAVRSADSLVRDDWYDAGVTINRDFDREAAAADLGLVAVMRLDNGGVLSLELDGEGVGSVDVLELQMTCPWTAARDKTIELRRDANGRFAPTVPVTDLPGRWDIALAPPGSDDGAWRIAGRVGLESGTESRLVATR